MKSLFELTLEEVVSGGRRSLKGLTSSLRREINSAWLKEEPTWREELYEDFPEDRVRGCELTHLIWQDSQVASDYMFSVPMYELRCYRSGRPDLVRTAGFICCKDDLDLTVFHVRTYEYSSLNQDQLFIELIPSKIRLRRLQALLLPIVKPWLDPKRLPVDFDWEDYYKELDRIEEDANHGCRIENHWKRFFGI